MLAKRIKIGLKILKGVIMSFIALILVLGAGEYLADEFFDNAASIDSCVDSGGAWNDDRERCRHDPTEPINAKNVE